MYRFIQSDPTVLGSKPHIKGTRLSVGFVLELFASGAERKQILSAYPQLNEDSLNEVMRYAIGSLRNEVVLTEEQGT